jgi:hypothetical protein
MEAEFVAVKLGVVSWPLPWVLSSSVRPACGYNDGWLTATINMSKITLWDLRSFSLTWGQTAAFNMTDLVGVDAGLWAIGASAR